MIVITRNKLQNDVRPPFQKEWENKNPSITPNNPMATSGDLSNHTIAKEPNIDEYQ